MGMYLILEFEEDEAAERFIQKVDDATSRGKLYRIIGIFKKPPKKRCTCAVENGWGEHRRAETARRHKKLGFIYCTQCKRVRYGPQSPKNLRQDDGEYGPYIHFTNSEDLSNAGILKNYPFLEAYPKPWKGRR